MNRVEFCLLRSTGPCSLYRTGTRLYLRINGTQPLDFKVIISFPPFFLWCASIRSSQTPQIVPRLFTFPIRNVRLGISATPAPFTISHQVRAHLITICWPKLTIGAFAVAQDKNLSRSVNTENVMSYCLPVNH